LAHLTGIGGFNTGADFFDLAGREMSKLAMATAVVPTLLATPLLPGATADVGQVHDHAARLHARNDALAQDLVAIVARP